MRKRRRAPRHAAGPGEVLKAAQAASAEGADEVAMAALRQKLAEREKVAAQNRLKELKRIQEKLTQHDKRLQQAREKKGGEADGKSAAQLAEEALMLSRQRAWREDAPLPAAAR
jgi:uncharacterized membrane protein YukC